MSKANEISMNPIQTTPRLDNLISRYEEPSPFARWDSPLFTIPWSDEGLPADDICDAITKGELRPPTQATVAVSYRKEVDSGSRGTSSSVPCCN